jgi:hypothetical protein
MPREVLRCILWGLLLGCGNHSIGVSKCGLSVCSISVC